MFVGAGFSTAKLKTLDLSFSPLSDFSQLRGRSNVPGIYLLDLYPNDVNFLMITCVFRDLQV